MKIRLSIKTKQELIALLIMMPLAELSTTLSIMDIKYIHELDKDIADCLMQIRLNVKRIERWLDEHK